MADVALIVDLALVHFLVLPLYKWSNLIPRVSHFSRGGKMRVPGNEAASGQPSVHLSLFLSIE